VGFNWFQAIVLSFVYGTFMFGAETSCSWQNGLLFW